MTKKILNIATWIAGTGLVLGSAVFGGAKYIAWEQIKEDRAIKNDSIMIQEFRSVRVKVDTLITRVEKIKGEQYIQIGGLKALDRSYNKHLKDKDELIEYQQMQLEELKKNEYLFMTPKNMIPSDMTLNGRKLNE